MHSFLAAVVVGFYKVVDCSLAAVVVAAAVCFCIFGGNILAPTAAAAALLLPIAVGILFARLQRDY